MFDLGLQEQVDHEMPTRRVAGDDDPVRGQPPLGAEPVPARADVGCGGGESMSRG